MPYAKKVQYLLKRRIPKFDPKEEWAPHSPDLNPCDFWLWSVVEVKSNEHPHATISSLKTAIRRAMAAIPRGKVATRVAGSGTDWSWCRWLTVPTLGGHMQKGYKNMCSKFEVRMLFSS